MKRLTQFWQRFAAGQILNVSQFRQERHVLKTERDHQGDSFDQFLGKLDGLSDPAPARLAVPSIMTDEAVLKQHHRADWQHVDRRLIIWTAKFIEAARRRGIPLYCHSAFRTKAEQNALVVQGVSKAKWPRAPHAQGKAVDIVHSRYHWDMTPAEWAFLAKLGRDVLHRYNQGLKIEDRLHLEWGGSWSFYDPAHWQIRTWADDIRQLAPGESLRLTPRKILQDLR